MSQRSVRLSIVIPSYNTGKFLDETLSSIRAQDFQDFECIVVDGASTDDTLGKLKHYPWVRWVSEQDSGYLEAFRKGLAMAQGEYVMQCCISDGYLDKSWFSKCVRALDVDKEVSLIWGLPQCMLEDGRLSMISYPQFLKGAPQKQDFFYYWLTHFFWFPEGNFCVRKNVMEKCFLPFINRKESVQFEPWLEFNFAFEKNGYLPLFLPSVANYGRIHQGQLGQREAFSGIAEHKSKLYFDKARTLRSEILWHGQAHVFRDGDGRELPYIFSRKRFFFREVLPPRKILYHFGEIGKGWLRKMMHALEVWKLMPGFVRNAIIARRRSKLEIE